MFDASYQIERAELAKRNLHVFRVEIEDHGVEEVLFQGLTRDEAKGRLLKWIFSEPFVHWLPERKEGTLADKLLFLQPCQEALDWLSKFGPRQARKAYETCERADWLLWLWGKCVKLNSPAHKKLVLVLCQIARAALYLAPAGENRPKIALETAEAWSRGKATKQNVAAAHAAVIAAAAHSKPWFCIAANTANFAYNGEASSAAGAVAATARANSDADFNDALAGFAEMVRGAFPAPPTVTFQKPRAHNRRTTK